ncbi:MAG: hypothetical protein KGI38_06505 [Thaumarchaeota archaeon]|nr:hypothetical protein [Nitrososphaerota archaeon]
MVEALGREGTQQQGIPRLEIESYASEDCGSSEGSVLSRTEERNSKAPRRKATSSGMNMMAFDKNGCVATLLRREEGIAATSEDKPACMLGDVVETADGAVEVVEMAANVLDELLRLVV